MEILPKYRIYKMLLMDLGSVIEVIALTKNIGMFPDGEITP